jgi:hypothetical protein
MTELRDVHCTHCEYTLGRVRKGRLAIVVRSRLVAVTPSGVEINCPSCRSSTDLPLVYSPDDGAEGSAHV